MYTLLTIKDKDYKLRLTTREIITLEKQLGCNPLLIFGADGSKIPTVTQMVYILHAALQSYHHGVSIADAYEIFDEYLEEKVMTDFIAVIMEIYKASGIISKNV